MTKKTTIDYEAIVQGALRQVVRDVLTTTARDGLIGRHHFYISYRTDFDGVDLPDYLRESYPEEVTIVLQYEYWDLEIDGDRFHVTLSFNNVHERLTVPFLAITNFVDPSAKFGLQFDHEIALRQLPVEMPTKKKARKKIKVVETVAADNAPPADGEISNVITLDAFRKK